MTSLSPFKSLNSFSFGVLFIQRKGAGSTSEKPLDAKVLNMTHNHTHTFTYSIN